MKIRGVRIEPREVEVVLGRFPNLQAAVVVARPGRDGARLVGYYVPANPLATGPVAAAELRAYLRARLPEVMVPTALVELERLPRSAAGKVETRALPEPPEEMDAEGFAPPATELEALLAELWSEVLGRPLATVGVKSDFFALGGHSLLAVRMLARLRDALEVELPLATVFDAPTIAGLALAIEERLSREAEELATEHAA